MKEVMKYELGSQNVDPSKEFELTIEMPRILSRIYSHDTFETKIELKM